MLEVGVEWPFESRSFGRIDIFSLNTEGPVSDSRLELILSVLLIGAS